jgi:uncharacterized protein (UPF0147 family)
MNSAKCPSCGVDYTDHAGLTGTCRELRKALARIEYMREYVRRLENDQAAPSNVRWAAGRIVQAFGEPHDPQT